YDHDQRQLPPDQTFSCDEYPTFTFRPIDSMAIEKPKPMYPPLLKSANVQGTVVVQVCVEITTGRVIKAKAISGHPLLQQAAVQAAYQARFPESLPDIAPPNRPGLLTYRFSP